MDPRAQNGGGRLAAVTGVTGFIGGHLAAEMARRGWRLRVLARAPSRVPALAGPPVEVVGGSLADAGALAGLVRGADAVLHLAGAVKGRSRADFMRANAEGTAALAGAWRREAPGARFLQLSSMAAREPGLSHYAASKHAADAQLRAVGGDARWHILRPAVVYGSRDRESLRIFRTAAGPVQPMLNGPAARITVVHVDDLVRAMLAALEADRPPACHEVTDARPEGYSWAEITAAAAAALGRPHRPVRVPRLVIRGLGLVGDVAALGGIVGMLTSQKAREILHPDWSSNPAAQLSPTLWRPEISLAEGFAEAVSWYRRAGWLR